MTSFKFFIKEHFKLSSGSTAFVGIMEPSDYPIITPEDYIVEIQSNSGKCYKFKSIGEDIFVRKDPLAKNIFRSLQTLENVETFTANINEDPIIIVGIKNDKV